MSSAPTEILPTQFIGQGQPGSRSLVVSRREATWVIPIDSRRVAAAGLHIYRPKSYAEVVAWYGTRWMAFPRFLGHYAREGIGLRGDLALAVSDRLGRSDLRFAVAVLQADRATVAAIAPSGDLVAFGKLAASETAAARVEREHAALGMARPQLPPSVQAPEVLYRGVLDGVEALLMSPVGGRRAASLVRLRDDDLRTLAALVRADDRKPLTALLPPPQALPTDEWNSLQSAVSTRLAGWRAELVATALVHGDFVPWNLVSRRFGLAAYDWEDALEEGAPFWDLWHFAVQSTALLHRWSDVDLVEAAVRRRGPLGHAVRLYARSAHLPFDLAAPVLAAYLEASGTVVGRHGGVARPDRVHGLRYRARLLAKLLEAW